MPKTAFAPLRLVEHLNFDQFRLLMFGYYHLCYALTIVDYERFRAEIYQNHTYVTTIICIDGSRRVKHRDTILQSQTTAGAHLCLVSFGERYAKPRGHKTALQGLKLNGLIETSPQVHACRQRCGVTRQGVSGVVYYAYLHAKQVSFLICVTNLHISRHIPSLFFVKRWKLNYFCNMVMNWTQLLSSKRLGQENRSGRKDDRSEFQRDFDRLIFSAAFRRLQNKAQVFPLPGSIFVHNRLTHSLEVGSVGRSLGNDIGRIIIQRNPELLSTHLTELGNIVSAACLAHDLGNPPFGHRGESAIRSYFREGEGQKLRQYICEETGDGLSPAQWNDLIHFEGNANAFRLLTHHFKGRRKGGFVMTYSTLASIVKYPFSSSLAGEKGKFGFFQAEQEDFKKIADELGILRLPSPEGTLRYARHPLVYLVEAADDICYEIMDIEDAHKLKLLTTDETKALLLAFFDKVSQNKILARLAELDDKNEQIVYLRSVAINLLENECVKVFVDHEEELLSGTFEGSLIEHICETPHKAYLTCVETAYEKIYNARMVVDIEIAGYKVITQLLDLMIEAATHSEKEYSKILISRVSSQYEILAPTLYERILAVLDYISGMTDVFALDLYRKINGMSLATV